MNDDWRLQIDFEKEGLAGHLIDHLDASELEHDLSTAYEDRVIVSHEGSRVFVYAGSREQAGAARSHIEKVAAGHGWPVEIDLRHWHPSAEQWEDPDTPLPAGDAAEIAEHEARIAAERAAAQEHGYPEFEVRMDFASRHEASAAAERLLAEGLPTVHRAKYLLVGVTDEDSAEALADRLRSELPSATKITAEGTLKAAWGERPPNPYAMVFGGLGG
jgi:hypothetical protein